MNCSTWPLLALVTLTLGYSAPKTLAADFSVRFVDGLGRAVPDALLEVYWIKSLAKNDVKVVGLFKGRSDREGVVKGSYDEKLLPKGEDLWVKVGKTGYGEYSTTGLRPEFGIKREFKAADLNRIAGLKDDAQQTALRELLASGFDRETALNGLVFAAEAKLRPALRALLLDPVVGGRAASLLGFIGVQDDLRLVVENSPAPRKELFGNRWAYQVVTAMLAPSTQAEWDFLRKCALNDYDDRWVDAGAIATLKLIASERSIQILEEVANQNPARAQLADKAVVYAKANPGPLEDKDLTQAGLKVAKAIRIGGWLGNGKPRFNPVRDKALLDCSFVTGRDRLTYAATFHLKDGIWKLRGVRETRQALMTFDGAEAARKSVKEIP